MGIRKSARSALKSTLTTDLAGKVAVVYDHLPKKLLGQSPVITIEIGSSDVVDTPDEPQWISFTLGLWVRRDSAGTAEDALDDLADLVRDVLRKKFNAVWTKSTLPDYAIDDGVPYRLEWQEVAIEYW